MLVLKNANRAITIFLVIAAAYFCWTAKQSSECTSTGIEQQTRTTWAPFKGCQMPDDYQKPWTIYQVR